MTTTDSEIERGVYQTPSNDDDLYDEYDDDEAFGRGPVFAILAVIVLAAFVGVVWLAYQQGLRQGQQSAPPIITASNDPFKVEPDDPQGMAEPEDSLTGDAIAGEPLQNVAEVTQSAEQPIESPPSLRTNNAAQNDEPASAATGDAAQQETPPDTAATTSSTTSAMARPTGGQVAVPPPSSSVQTADLDGGNAPQSSGTAVPPPSTSGASAPDTSGQTATVPPPSSQAATSGATTPASRPRPEPVESAGPPSPGSQETQTATSTTGNFVVQVASSPAEDDAIATWNRISSRYSEVLSGYTRDIQSVDLGDRGTWYRLRFGYFETRSAAADACTRLQAAGQDCLVATR